MIGKSNHLHFPLNILPQEQGFGIVPWDYCLPSSPCEVPSIVTVNWFHWKFRHGNTTEFGLSGILLLYLKF